MAKKDKKDKKERVFDVPLKKIMVTAKIAGVFAEVTCAQTYRNDGKNPVEAIYVFPMPEESSVAGCRMIIGDKKVEAELKEAGQARKEYNEAVAAGNYGGLLEQKRSNIFRMSVGGIGAGETVEVVTVYNQRVPWQNKGGRFNIPLVVAPRFIPGKPTGKKTGGGWAEDTDEVPDASQITPVVAKDGVSYTADITVNLSAGFPCEITSPSHGLIVGEHHSKGTRALTIKASDLIPDRDFIVCYQTESDKVEAGVHCGTFNNEQFAVVEVIPPGQTRDKRKDVVFCLDRSGSMSGPKVEGLKLVAEKILRRLEQNPRNRVGIVVFNEDVREIHPLSEISEATFAAICGISAKGTTRAGRALDYCFKQFSAETAREKYILLVSDGQTEDMWTSVTPGVRVISVGIDTAVNAGYLRDIARETKGTNINVYPGEDYDVIASTVAGLLSGPVLRDVNVSLEALGVSDVYQTMPGVIYLKGTRLPEEIQINGKDPKGKEVSLNVVLKGSPECSFSHQLWAREKLRDHTLSAEEQVKISLAYGVLCSKTAFVAVLLKEVPGQKPERVEVPVSLPHTWNYDAVFGTGSPGAFFSMRSMSSSRVGSLGSLRGAPSLTNLGPFTGGGPARPHRPSIPTLSLNHASKLEDLVNQLDKGTIAMIEAEKQWKVLSAEITPEKAKKWTALGKAKAFYLLLKLRSFGFTVSVKVLEVINEEPSSFNTEAHSWWLKARRHLGVAVT